MKKVVFTGSGVAIVTPMNADGSIHYPELEKLIHFQVNNKTDAIIICGTTGESSTLTDEEHVELIRFAVEKVDGRVPVVAGVGSNDTAYAVWLSEEAEKAGADALLHVTPYYNKTSQSGLVRHFTAVADSTDLPVILYNVPSRTGLDIKPATYAELAKHPKIVATKEANGNLSAMAQTAALCGDDLAIYSGNDDQIVTTMSLGGLGVISVAANIVPKVIHDMAQAFLDGDVKKSRQLQLDYLALIDALFADVNPTPVKEALNMMGYAAGPTRLPLAPIESAAGALLATALKKYGLIG